MRLFGRNDIVLLGTLAIALWVVFSQPLQQVFDFVRDIEDTYQVRLLPALMILVGMFVFHQYRKREEARVSARAAATAAEMATTRADGKKMLFLRNHGDQDLIDLRTEAHDERQDRKDREIKTDAPGTIGQSAGYSGRVAYEETDFHQLEEDDWVKEAAEELKKRALRNDFEALAIIAPPKALGVLRKELHKEVEKRIVLTLNKEMTDRPIPDIEALLVGETKAEELSPF